MFKRLRSRWEKRAALEHSPDDVLPDPASCDYVDQQGRQQVRAFSLDEIDKRFPEGFNYRLGRAWRGKGKRAIRGVGVGEYEITAFTGLKGSGKTYSMVEKALEFHKLHPDSPVIVSPGFECSFATGTFNGFKGFCNLQNMYPDKLVLVLWDELPISVNARKWQEFPDNLFVSLTQVRKTGIVLYYSAIQIQMVDLTVQRVTDVEMRCHKTFFGRMIQQAELPPPMLRGAHESPRFAMPKFLRRHVMDSYDTQGLVNVDMTTLEGDKKMDKFFDRRL